MTVYALQWQAHGSAGWETWRVISDEAEARRLYAQADEEWEARPRPSWADDPAPHRLVSFVLDEPVGDYGVMGGDEPPGLVVLLP